MGSKQARDDLIGAQIGNYVVKEVIGHGGMGTVYRAVHPKIGKHVAMKVLSDDIAKLGNAAARFEVEAKLVARINHRNVIEIFDYGSLDDGRLYYTMAMIEGRSLTDVLEEKGRLTPAEALTFLQPICAALQAAHDLGVVHRDLKPDNIMVLDGETMEVKVLDFGIAKLLESTDTQSLNTTMGTVMGTPMFIAPEQASGLIDHICPATDLYSLGVMLYMMLSGEPPLFHEAVGILMAMHIKDEPPPLRDKAPAVPESIARLVHRCLAKDPLDRPVSAKVIADDYASLLEGGKEAAVDDREPASRVADEDNMQMVEVTGPTIASPTGPPSTDTSRGLMDTTMGGSSGEVSVTTLGLRTSDVPRLVMAAGVAVILGVLGFLIWPSGKEIPPVMEAAHPAPAAALVAASKSKTALPAFPPRNVRVEVAGAKASCRLQVATGAAIKRDAPCEFQVKQGAEVRLEVMAQGLRPFKESFTANADRKLALVVDIARKQLTRSPKTPPRTPAKAQPSSEIEKQQAKRAATWHRKKNRRRHKKAGKPPAPGPPEKKTEPKKKPSRIGEGVMNID